MNSPVDELKLCPICKGDGYAAEGELSAIKKWIEDNRAPEPYDFSDDPHGEFQPMGDDNDIVYADVLLEFISALQSRSTPPPVGWGRLPVSLQRLAESWQQEGNFLRGPNDCELDHAVGRAYLNCRDQLLAALQHQDGVFTDKQFSHEAADAFWKYWNENGETDKHGYYESTWGAIWRAIWTDYPHLKQSLERKKRCLESLRWKTEGDPPVDVWVLFFRHSTGEYMVDIPDKDEMPGEWKRGGWTHWLPIPQ